MGFYRFKFAIKFILAEKKFFLSFATGKLKVQSFRVADFALVLPQYYKSNCSYI